jgi:hypothetical protein
MVYGKRNARRVFGQLTGTLLPTFTLKSRALLTHLWVAWMRLLSIRRYAPRVTTRRIGIRYPFKRTPPARSLGLLFTAP